jgi:hypothetical protein
MYNAGEAGGGGGDSQNREIPTGAGVGGPQSNGIYDMGLTDGIYRAG